MTAVVSELFAEGFPRIEGARVRLRAIVAEDAAAILRLYGDREANRYGYSPKMESLDDAAELIADIHDLARKGTLFHFGVADSGTDAIVGHATLFHIVEEHHRGEIGYSMHRALWGRGLATEAVRLLVGFAFERGGLRRLEADADPRNVGSLRVLEKVGFRREGYLRERWELAGELQDAVVFGLLRREYAEERGR